MDTRPPSPLEITRTALPADLALDADAVSWSGPACAAADAPVVRVRVPRASPAGEAFYAAVLAGDAVALDAAAGALALPAGLLDALAARCIARAPEGALAVATGRAGGDVRLRRALAAAAAARGSARREEVPATEPARLFDPGPGMYITHLRALPDDRIAVLTQPQPWVEPPPPTVAHLWLLTPGKGPPSRVAEFALGDQVEVSILVPTARGDATAVVVAAVDPARAALAVYRFAPDGSLARVAFGRAPSHPHQYTDGDALLWIHCERHHVALAPGAAAAGAPRDPLAIPPGGPPEPRCALERGDDRHWDRATSVGAHLAAFSLPRLVPNTGWISAEMTWCDLALREPPVAVPFGLDKRAVRITPEAIWVTAPDGVYRAAPREPFARVFEGTSAFGLDVSDPAELLVGAGNELVCVERATGQARLRTDVGHAIYEIERAPRGGAIARSNARFTWVDAAGAIRASSAERRDTGFARLADGTIAVSAGEDVLVIGPDGEPRRRLTLPYDGQVMGATATHFVFGTISGGIAHTPPDAFYAIDGEGRVTARVHAHTPEGDRVYVRPGRIFYAGGTTADTGAFTPARLLMVAPDRALVSWDPAAPAGAGSRAGAVVQAPGPMREERGARAVRGDTYNPRDDWDEPGVDVRGGSFFALGCEYGGTTGVCRGPALRADDGAVATLAGCKLTNGGLVRLGQASTVVLIGCELEVVPGETWELGAHCHLALIDCRLAAPFDATLAPGASIVATGCEVATLWAYDGGERVRVTPGASVPAATNQGTA